ncbi:hypothetical protein AMS58_15390 [Pseudoalteromonas porphyrae]|nr:hypothetical protein AMS58_15390 [Pseudoalteromonas porphyrae]
MCEWFIQSDKGLPLLMHRVFQLFYIMNKAIQLPQNKVNAFTFVCPRKVNLFMSLLTVILHFLPQERQA